MRTIIVRLFLVAMLADGYWTFTFETSPENNSVQMITQCRNEKEKVNYQAVDQMPILDEGQTSVRMRQQPTPRGVQCSVLVYLLRGEGDGYVHESLILTQQR